MSLKRFDGANWVDIAQCKRFDGANWVDAQEVKRWDGGSWVSAWTGLAFMPTSLVGATLSLDASGDLVITLVNPSTGIASATFQLDPISGFPSDTTTPVSFNIVSNIRVDVKLGPSNALGTYAGYSTSLTTTANTLATISNDKAFAYQPTYIPTFKVSLRFGDNSTPRIITITNIYVGTQHIRAKIN